MSADMKPCYETDLLPPLESCQLSLDECIRDLDTSRSLRSTPAWYQNELVIVGLSFIAFTAGYSIGVTER